MTPELCRIKTTGHGYYDSVKRHMRKSLKDSGLNIDSTNNRYMPEFFKSKSPEYEKFVLREVSSYNINWSEFLEFFSIFRHSILHNGGVFTTEGLDELNKRYEILLTLLYMITPLDATHYTIQLKTGNQHNFWSLISDFVANTIKIISGEKSRDFIA